VWSTETAGTVILTLLPTQGRLPSGLFSRSDCWPAFPGLAPPCNPKWPQPDFCRRSVSYFPCCFLTLRHMHPLNREPNTFRMQVGGNTVNVSVIRESGACIRQVGAKAPAPNCPNQKGLRIGGRQTRNWVKNFLRASFPARLAASTVSKLTDDDSIGLFRPAR
jgi:hypothetical protein